MKVDISKWELKTLGDVCTFKRGLTYPKTEESAVITSNVVLRSNNIDLNTCALVFNELKYLSDLYNIPNERKLVKDSILMCMSNGSSAHIGKVAYIDKDYDYAFGGFMGLIIPNNINPKFLYYKYRSESFKTFLGKIGNGINITNLKFSTISPLPIYVPTLAEQEIIVRELNALQEMIDGYNAQLHDLDELIKSIFNNTFGEPISNPKGWDIDVLENIVSDDCPITYGIVQPGDEVNDGIPVVRPVDLIGTYVNKALLKKVSPEISDSYKRTILKGNEILICVRGTTGVVSLATEDMKECNVTRGIVPLSFTRHNKWFMYWCIKSFEMNNLIKKYTKGATLKQINIKDLRQLPFPTPPLELQEKFGKQAELIETQRVLLNQQISDARNLMAERMQYYFS